MQMLLIQMQVMKSCKNFKITVVIVGIIGVTLGIAFESQNIAYMVGLAFGIAASANFPILFLSFTGVD